MGLNGGQGAVVWLNERTIGKKVVYILGYKSADKHMMERALPKSEYQKMVGEMKEWMTAKAQRRIAVVGPGCNESVRYEENKKMKYVCFDGVKKPERVKFAQWYTSTVHTALGMF